MFKKEIINRAFIRSVVVAAVMLILSACGSSIEGTYSGSGKAANWMHISLQATFDSDTVIVKAHTSMGGQTVGQSETEYEYKLDGNKIKVKTAQEVTEIWTLEDDGSITARSGGSTIKLTRKKEA